jgi:hypothetical protein
LPYDHKERYLVGFARPVCCLQIPTFGFLYVAGWIGYVGRLYLNAVRKEAKPTEKEIIIDVPAALRFAWQGATWPVQVGTVTPLVTGWCTAAARRPLRLSLLCLTGVVYPHITGITILLAHMVCVDAAGRHALSLTGIAVQGTVNVERWCKVPFWQRCPSGISALQPADG